MNSKWLMFAKTEEERNTTRLIVKNSVTILGLLAQILTKELQELESTSSEDYNVANWPYYRADRDGAIRQTKQLLKLIKGDNP
jgi:hypothetical protein